MAYLKVPCLYNSVKDLQARLENSIVRYKGEPCYLEVEGKLILRLMTLPDPRPGVMSVCEDLKKIHPQDVDFDISSPEIGYVNDIDLKGNPVTYYLSRIPSRQWRQGLNSNSVSARSVLGSYAELHWGIFTKRVGDMITGQNYPDIPSAIAMLRLTSTGTNVIQRRTIAIHRDVALFQPDDEPKVVVYYKNTRVGSILNPTGLMTFVLNDDKSLRYPEIYERLLKISTPELFTRGRR